MFYFKAILSHPDNEYPVLLYSELDKDRYETRKIEIYKNEKIGYAYSDIE